MDSNILAHARAAVGAPLAAPAFPIAHFSIINKHHAPSHPFRSTITADP